MRWLKNYIRSVKPSDRAYTVRGIKWTDESVVVAHRQFNHFRAVQRALAVIRERIIVPVLAAVSFFRLKYKKQQYYNVYVYS